jgi:glycosyltransferase involved in cell wall biosynthesis
LRTLVYTDYAYQRAGERVYSERAFSLFLAGVAERAGGTFVVLGRVRPEGDDVPGAPYELGPAFEFIGLPWYRSLVAPSALPGIVRSLRAGWKAIGTVDRVWLLGPHPLILVLAMFAFLRRRPLILGVRQDFPTYIASRRPNSRLARAAAWLLEHSFRALARRCPTVVVGPELAHHYAKARALLEIPVSLVSADQIVDEQEALARDYTGPKTVLTVGRLDTEKNPLALAEILEKLIADGGDWRLEVCGEGPLADDLAAELRRRGLAERAELAGYVAYDGGLIDRYRGAHVLLHFSLSEGLPQVLLEAFAAGLPVVASDVGGIGEALGDAVALVPAGDVTAAEDAIAAIAADSARRGRLIGAGFAYIKQHTYETETDRVAAFLGSQVPAGTG